MIVGVAMDIVCPLIMIWISCTVGDVGKGCRMERKRDPARIEVYQIVIVKNKVANTQGIRIRFEGSRPRGIRAAKLGLLGAA